MTLLRRDAGQATVVGIGIVAVLGALVLGVATLGRYACDAARAQTAADASALAAVTGGRSQAMAWAAANGAELVALHRADDNGWSASVVRVVQVTVRVGTARASARAILES